MRRIVKRLLKKYKYPPEEEQNALDTVIKQCEQWVDVEPVEYHPFQEQPTPKLYSFDSDSESLMAAEP